MNEKLECEINTNLLHSWTVGLVVPYILSTACVCANTPLLFELTNECFFFVCFCFHAYSIQKSERAERNRRIKLAGKV